jgi:hypothetical protein
MRYGITPITSSSVSHGTHDLHSVAHNIRGLLVPLKPQKLRRMTCHMFRNLEDCRTKNNYCNELVSGLVEIMAGDPGLLPYLCIHVFERIRRYLVPRMRRRHACHVMMRLIHISTCFWQLRKPLRSSSSDGPWATRRPCSCDR